MSDTQKNANILAIVLTRTLGLDYDEMLVNIFDKNNLLLLYVYGYLPIPEKRRAINTLIRLKKYDILGNIINITNAVIRYIINISIQTEDYELIDYLINYGFKNDILTSSNNQNITDYILNKID